MYESICENLFRTTVSLRWYDVIYETSYRLERPIKKHPLEIV